MALGLPVAILAGTVRRVSVENVPPRHDETTGQTRPGYVLTTAVVDTGLAGPDSDGGTADLTVRGDKHPGVEFGNGQVVTVKVRPYVGWSGPVGRKRASVRYAFAGEVESGGARAGRGAAPA